MTDPDTTMAPRRALLAIVSVIALLALAGCGNDDGDGVAAASGDVVESGTAGADEAAVDTDEETTDADADADAEAAPAPGGDFCEQVAGATRYFQPPDDGVEYSEYLDVLGAIDPPAEIAGDWNAMLDGIAAFQEVDFDDPDAMDAAFADPALEASMEGALQVNEFVLDECGIDLNVG